MSSGYYCHICKYSSIFRDYVVRCDSCNKYTCSRCFNCRKSEKDESVDWTHKGLCIEKLTIKKGFCSACGEDGWVYVVLINKEDTNVWVFKEELDAKEFLHKELKRIVKEYEEEFNEKDAEEIAMDGINYSIKKLKIT